MVISEDTNDYKVDTMVITEEQEVEQDLDFGIYTKEIGTMLEDTTNITSDT